MLYGDLFIANVCIGRICQRHYIDKALLVRQVARSVLWRRAQWLFYKYCDHELREKTATHSMAPAANVPEAY